MHNRQHQPEKETEKEKSKINKNRMKNTKKGLRLQELLSKTFMNNNLGLIAGIHFMKQ